MTRRPGLLAAVLIALAGCGSHHDARTPATPTATAGTQACGEPDERTHAIRFRTSDGVSLAGAVIGSGPVGAVLIHEYPLDHCGWWPYARYLARHGVRVLMFDLRCFGHSACPAGRGHPVTDVAAAMDELRRRGAQRVALVGASMGGAISVVAAARLHPAAVVDLSGESDTSGLTPGIEANSVAAAPGVTAPALFAVARGDRYVTPADMRTVARRARSPSKRVIVLPASEGHGWDMLLGTTSEFSPLAATVASFIRRNAAPPTPPLEKCPDGGWKPLPTSGIYGPTAARLGRGRVGVVFANDSDNVTCAWRTEARSLAAHGYAVAVFETAGNWTYENRQALAVAHALRKVGVERFALIGASVGARAVLLAAAAHPRDLVGVVAMSAERRVGASQADLLPVGRRVRVPALSIGSREDAFTDFGKDTAAWDRTIPDDRALILSGDHHGVEFLTDRHGPRVRAAILAFLRPL